MHRLTRLTLQHPRTATALLILSTAALASGLPALRTEFGFRVLIGGDHPAVQRLDRMIEQFGGGFPAIIAWECGAQHSCRHALDEASLGMADEIVRDLASSPGIRSVVGPSNAPLMVPTDGGFELRSFVESGEVVADAEALAIRALNDPLWVGELISEDGLVGAIIAQPIDTQSETELWLVDEIQRILKPYEAAGFRFALQGGPTATVVSGRELSASIARIIPLIVVGIGLVVLLVCGSWQQTIVVLGAMGLALLWTFGLMGWLDWPQDGIHEILAPLVLVVGVCDGVHLLSRTLAAPSNLSERDRLLWAARDVGTACVVTTATTTAAFLSFTSSDLSTFQRFGAIAAFGAVACLVLTFTALPLAAYSLPAGRAQGRVRGLRLETALRRVLDLAHRRCHATLAVGILLLAFFGWGWAAHLEVGTSWNEFFGSESTIRRWAHFIQTRLGATESLEVHIELDADAALEDPSTLERIARLETGLARIPGVGAAQSIAGRLRRANRLLHEDDSRFDRTGSTASANAELLEILSLGSAEDLGRWVSMDRRQLRVSAAASTASYREDSRVTRAAHRAVESAIPDTWPYSITGEVAANASWMEAVQITQLRSFPTALFLAWAILVVYFRSAFLTLAALLPTLIPVVVTLGAMGWLGMNLDIGRAMIAAILIGIGVDDAVHVLTRYRRELAANASPDLAIRRAVLHAGPAVATTSVALCLGFLALTASAWQTVSSFGLFISLAIAGAMVSTLLVLPSIVFALAGRAAVGREPTVARGRRIQPGVAIDE